MEISNDENIKSYFLTRKTIFHTQKTIHFKSRKKTKRNLEILPLLLSHEKYIQKHQIIVKNNYYKTMLYGS